MAERTSVTVRRPNNIARHDSDGDPGARDRSSRKSIRDSSKPPRLAEVVAPRRVWPRFECPVRLVGENESPWRAATRPGEDRVSEDGLTGVRAYARVNEVSGTHP